MALVYPYDDEYLIEFCVRNAIGLKVMPQCQLRSLSANQHAKLIGRRDANNPAIHIPYFDMNGKPVEYFRTVTMQTKANGWQQYLTYQHKEGLAERIYFPPFLDWRQIAADPQISVYFYDNEIDAIKACNSGRAAVCDPGLKTWKERDDHGSPRWLDEGALYSDDRDWFDVIGAPDEDAD